jgi:DNA-binding protein YbaB
MKSISIFLIAFLIAFCKAQSTGAPDCSNVKCPSGTECMIGTDSVAYCKPLITCANVLCTPDSKCFDTPGGPECRCTEKACGIAPGAPNYECKDGTIGGPVCGRNADGVCGWKIRECPVPPTCKCDEMKRPTDAPEITCPDGSISGYHCQTDPADSTMCDWKYRDCPKPKECTADDCGADPNAVGGATSAELCPDGSIAGSFCVRNANMECKWQKKECPVPKDCVPSDCGTSAPTQEKCPDGTLSDIFCKRNADGRCGWVVGSCPTPPPGDCVVNGVKCEFGCEKDTAGNVFCTPPPKDCVFCAAVVVGCDPNCKNCIVTEQTCDRCQNAYCKDVVVDACADLKCEEKGQRCNLYGPAGAFCEEKPTCDNFKCPEGQECRMANNFVCSSTDGICDPRICVTPPPKECTECQDPSTGAHCEKDSAGNPVCVPNKCDTTETKFDGCNTCFCNDGLWACTLMACIPEDPPTTCKPSYEKADAAGMCKVCVCNDAGDRKCALQPCDRCENDETFTETGDCVRRECKCDRGTKVCEVTKTCKDTETVFVVNIKIQLDSNDVLKSFDEETLRKLLAEAFKDAGIDVAVTYNDDGSVTVEVVGDSSKDATFTETELAAALQGSGYSTGAIETKTIAGSTSQEESNSVVIALSFSLVCLLIALF